MPTKRKNAPTGTARKPTSPGLPRAFGRAGSKKSKEPSLNLLLRLLDEKIAQRFDALDRKIDAVDKKVDAVDRKVDAHRQETAAEFKAVRGEMAQGLNSLRQEFTTQLESSRQEFSTQLETSRQELTTQLESSRQEFSTKLDSLRQELTTKMDGVSEAAYQHYLRIEKGAQAKAEYYQQSLNNLQTAMDTSAKNYDDFKENRERFNDKIHELQSEVKELKKRDMEKAAAIERIEKQLNAA